MVAGRAATMFYVGARMRVPSQMRAFGVDRKVSTASRKPKVSVRAQGTSDTTSVAVLGAGAAGLTAAYFAAAHGAKRVVVYERTSEAGKKILMSGGARCNVLPVSARVEDFVTESTPRKLKNIMASWNVERCREWLENDIGLELGIEHVTNKYFPLSNNSREVRDKLVEACLREGVDIRYGASVEGLRRVSDDGADGEAWSLLMRDCPDERVSAVILAMGGMSFPAVGTDGTGYVIARRDLEHNLAEPYPALVPLTGKHPGGEQLPGVSVNVSLECEPIPGGIKTGKKKKAKANREGFLFTHRGFSGPAVLDLSHNVVRSLVRTKGCNKGEDVEQSDADMVEVVLPSLVVSWSGESRDEWQERLAAPPGKALVATRLREGLPQRLADALLAEAGVDNDCKVADLRRVDRLKLLDVLTKYRIPVDGHQGYRKAEVTGGGVPLDEINFQSMESLKSPGVYFCGEVCDVFGRIGGFNFLWAWTSGRLAGMSAAKLVSEKNQ